MNKIVVCGHARSGNNLLSVLLGSHSKVAMIYATHQFWEHGYKWYGEGEQLEGKQIHALYGYFYPKLLKDRSFCFNMEEQADVWSKINTAQKLTAPNLLEIMGEVFCKKSNKEIFAMKDPGAEGFVGDIVKEWNDEVKIVHIVRNPLKILDSKKKSSQESLLVNPLHLWILRRSLLSAVGNKQYKNNYFLIKYEDLIEKPYEVIETLCKDLGLTYEEEMFEMKGDPTWTGSNSSFGDSQGKGIHKEPSLRKLNLPEFDQLVLYLLLKKPSMYLGYNLEAVKVKPKYIFKLFSFFIILLVQVIGMKYLATLKNIFGERNFMKLVNKFRKLKNSIGFS